MVRRYAARVDNNQKQIVADLRGHGLFVEIIGKPVDLLIWYDGWHIVDTKNPERRGKSKGGDERTAEQKRFVERSPGPVHFCETTDEILKAVGYLA